MTYNDIEFIPESHAYFLGMDFIPSVSSKLTKFYKPFDSKVARYVAKSKGVTEEQVKRDWKKTNKDAIDLGKKTHDYAEKFIKNEVTHIPVTTSENSVVKWLQTLDKNKYDVVFVEKPIYSKEYWFAGTPDLVLLDKETNTYEIVDYKTNKNLFKNYKSQKLLYPFNKDLDTPINKYKLQLGHYQIALEEFGYKVSNRRIVWLPREGEYEEYYLDDCTQQLKDYYKQ